LSRQRTQESHKKIKFLEARNAELEMNLKNLSTSAGKGDKGYLDKYIGKNSTSSNGNKSGTQYYI
jgi:hypothetical protein